MKSSAISAFSARNKHLFFCSLWWQKFCPPKSRKNTEKSSYCSLLAYWTFLVVFFVATSIRHSRLRNITSSVPRCLRGESFSHAKTRKREGKKEAQSINGIIVIWKSEFKIKGFYRKGRKGFAKGARSVRKNPEI